MITFHHLSAFTSDELGRIHKTLATRFRIGIGKNILQVGFGIAERSGQLDPERKDTVCFYVSNKRLPRKKIDRIPSTLSIRIRREKQFVLAELSTDVIEVDRRQSSLTGRKVRHLSRKTIATAGAIVAWRSNSNYPLEWGVITVGHLFWSEKVNGRSRAINSPKNVRVAVSGNREIEGELLIRSCPHDDVDAALVLVNRKSLVEGGILPVSATTRKKKIRSINQLSQDSGHSGVTLPEQNAIPMTVLRYLPQFTLIQSIGIIRHVLDVRSDLPNAFGQGRSGALWIISDQASCHQFAGWQSTNPSEDYVRGIGQSIEYIFDWLRKQLAKQAKTKTSEIDLRLIREL